MKLQKKLMENKFVNFLNKDFVKKEKNVNFHMILKKMKLLIFILIKENNYLLKIQKKKKIWINGMNKNY